MKFQNIQTDGQSSPSRDGHVIQNASETVSK